MYPCQRVEKLYNILKEIPVKWSEPNKKRHTLWAYEFRTKEKMIEEDYILARKMIAKEELKK